MYEQQYRKRLDQDLARWEAEGVVSADARAAIRASLGPMPKGIDLTGAVAVVGGLLIAAAFLAFVAANWEAIPRPLRFGMLAAGIVVAFAIGAIFVRMGASLLADLAATVGCIIFGAAIALTGQMYHLGEDFAGGMMLWALGALIAAALTGSRGALAVALTTACIWSGARAFEAGAVHLPFLAFWLTGAALGIAWQSTPARHLVAAAAVAWWTMTALAQSEGLATRDAPNAMFTLAAGTALMFGGGLVMMLAERLRPFGRTLATYAAFAFAAPLAIAVAGGPGSPVTMGWEAICGVVGVILAAAAAFPARRPGPVLAAASLGLGLVAIALYARPEGDVEPWLSYALALVSMLAMVISGMLDDERPRVVAGWVGLAAAIAVITWTVKGSLLRRALFLAVAGGIAIALAVVLGRFMPNREARDDVV